jgi:hypothetical protein
VCACACVVATLRAELRATDVHIAISQLLATTRTPHVACGSRWPPEGTVQCHQPFATHNVTSPTPFTTSPHVECSGWLTARRPPLHCTERRATPTKCKTKNATGSEAVERTARCGRIPLCSRLPPWLRKSVGGGLCAGRTPVGNLRLTTRKTCKHFKRVLESRLKMYTLRPRHMCQGSQVPHNTLRVGTPTESR